MKIKTIKNITLMITLFSLIQNSMIIPDNVFAESSIQTREIDFQDKYNVNWKHILKGEQDKEDKFYDIVQLSDGGYVAVGQSATLNGLSGYTDGDAVIVKYDKDGGEQWRKYIEEDETERFYSVIELQDNSILAFGITYSNIDNNNPNNLGKPMIAKYASNGDEDWVKLYDGATNAVAINNAVLTSDGAILVNLASVEVNLTVNAVEKDILKTEGFMKISPSDGDLISTITDVGDYDLYVSDMKSSIDGNSFVLGHVKVKENSTEFTLGVLYKLDSSGAVVKTCEITSMNTPKSFVEGKENYIYIAGEDTYVSNSKNYKDAILTYFDVNLNEEVWTQSISEGGDNSFEAMAINSNGDLIVIGHSSASLENTTINGKKEAIIVKYGKDGKMSDIVNLGNDTQGLLVYKAIVDSNDKLIMVGKYGEDGNGDSCDFIEIANCTQYDAMIISVEEELEIPTCSTAAPVITGDNATIKTNTKINPLSLVSMADPELAHLKNSITFVTNLETEDTKEYYSSKEGDFTIKYSVINECGRTGELELTISVKDEVSCSVPVITVDKEYVYYIGDNLDVTELGTVTGLADGEDVANSSLEMLDNGYTKVVQTYGNGATLTTISNIDFTKAGTYDVEFIAKNDCAEVSETMKIYVIDKDSVAGTVSKDTETDKPQTGDNAYIYLGLFIVAVIGLVLVNIKKKDDEESETTLEDDESIDKELIDESESDIDNDLE